MKNQLKNTELKIQMTEGHGKVNKYSKKRIFYVVVSIFFLSVYLLKWTKDIKFGGIGYWSYLPSVLFLAVFTLRIRILWFVGFIYSLFALYNVFFVNNVSGIKSYEFTFPLVKLFYGSEFGYSTSSPVAGILFSIPFFFYVLYVLIFSIDRIKGLYVVLKK